jgi:hypothetical protein
MLCNLQVAKVSDYFTIEHLDSFYQLVSPLNYGDSLISTKEIQIGNYAGKERVLRQRFQDRIIRQRIWLDDQYFYTAKIYIDDDSIYSPAANQYFSSFKKIKNTTTFDPFEAKDQALFSALQSRDSLTRYRANTALIFYNFAPSNVEGILAAIQVEYPKDSLTVARLIYRLQSIADTSVLRTLIDLYKKPHTNTAPRIAI